MSSFAPESSIGKYRVVRVLGMGGMGVVYEARHVVLGNRVALKTLRSDTRSAAIAERFRNEALAASRLRDDRLPQIFDIDQLEDGTQYIVMEFLEGQDLAVRLRSGALEPGHAARILLEILEVLAKVHQLGIIHRDLKPANIFMARSEVLGEMPKLLDFGVAHMTAREERHHAHMLVGTPLYMAPEQALGGAPIGPWTDIFAAGVVLFELIAGRGQRPWAYDSELAYFQALASDEPPRSLTKLVPQVPPLLARAIHRALARVPGQRYPDALAFARALEPFAISRTGLYRVGLHGGRLGEGEATPSAGSAPPEDATVTVGEQRHALAPARTSPVATSLPSGASLHGQKLAGLRARLEHLRRGVVPPTSGPRQGEEPRLKDGERRHITILYVITRFSQLGGEALSTEEFEDLSARALDIFTQELEREESLVRRQPDGALMAIFGFERVREDDAERTVMTALALLRYCNEVNASLREIGYALSCQLGLHSGFASRLLGAQQEGPLGGDALNVAMRLAEQAPPNGILGSGDILDSGGGNFLLRPVGRLAIKGRAEPVEAREVLGTTFSRWSQSFEVPSDPMDGPGLAPKEEPGSMALLASRRTAPFIGREEELRQLQSVLERVKSQATPALVLVSGLAGVGKTRLVDEFLSGLAHRSNRPPEVIHARPLVRRPYGLWTALLYACLSRLRSRHGSLGGVLPQLLEELGTSLEPERREQLRVQQAVIGMLLGQDEAAFFQEHSAQALGERIQSAVTLCLEAAVRRAAPAPGDEPLVLSLAEMHRADDASLALLPRVLQGLRAPVPPLLVMTTRESAGIPLPDGLPCVHLPLGPLEAQEVEVLAGSLAPEAQLSPAVRDFVVRRAGGSPLFVEELVLSLRDRELLGASPERLRHFSPPTSLHGLLLERVDRLEPRLRELLRLASVLGVDFEPEVFLALAEAAAIQLGRLRLEHVSPLRALEELAACGLLEQLELPDGNARYTFRPAQLQGAMYGTVLSENKRVLHLMAAKAIERVHAQHLDRHSSRLLHHYSHTDDVACTVRYARLVGQRVLALGAYDEATEALMRAVALQEQLAEPDALPAARTLLDLATASLWSGRLGLAETQARQAAERLDQALAAAVPPSSNRQALLELRGRASMTCASVGEMRGDWASCMLHFEQAERAFSEAGLKVAAAQARCDHGFILRSSGRPAEGLRLVREGWSALEDSDNLAAIARAGHDLGNVLRDVGEYQEALRIFDRVVAAGDELRRRGNTFESTWGALAGRSGRAMTHAALGNTLAAIEDQRAARDLSVVDGNRLAHTVSEYHLATHLLAHGDLEEAERSAAQAFRMSMEIGMTSRALKCRLVQLQIAWRNEAEPERTAGLLREAEELATQGAVSAEAWHDLVLRLRTTLEPEPPWLAAVLERARTRAGRSQQPH